MPFTYAGYIQLLNLLKENGYEVAGYHSWKEYDKCVVLRHDVDNDLTQALSMAKIEHGQGVRSTFFVLLTSNFYNLYSGRNRGILRELRDMGHTIGLHFDEMAYPEDAGKIEQTVQNIKEELNILSEMIKDEVTIFSYHRPTKAILNAEIIVESVVNSYSNTFFRKFKYLSDSRMHWREPVADIIRKGIYSRLHILTHSFWYHDEERDIRSILEVFMKRAYEERYSDMKDNFTDLDGIMDMGGNGL